MMRDVVIVAGARTPVGAFGGSLKTTPVVALGALVLKATLKKAGLRPLALESLTCFEPDALKGEGMTDLEKEAYDYDDALQPVQIDEVIMGNVVGAGQGQNIARQAMIRAGISKETGAFHDQQAVRIGHEGRGPCRPGDSQRRRRGRPGGGHGEHEHDPPTRSRPPGGAPGWAIPD